MATLPTVYGLEILVKASSEKEAYDAVTSITTTWGAGGKIIEHGHGYYVAVDSFPDSELTDEFYEKIKQAENLAILSDASAKTRRDAILNDASLVEVALRKLLLHISESVENYYELFKKGQYAKEHASKQAIIMANKTDPITSHLQFGDIIDLLGADLNVSKRNLSGMEEWAVLLEGKTTLDELRTDIAERLKRHLVWEVISDNLLVAPQSWDDLKKSLDMLKVLRNRAGHFQSLSPKDVVVAKELREGLLAKIGDDNHKPSTEVDYTRLSGLDDWISERLVVNVVSAFEQAQAAAMSQQWGAIASQVPDWSKMMPSVNESILSSLTIKPDWSTILPSASIMSSLALKPDLGSLYQGVPASVTDALFVKNKTPPKKSNDTKASS